MNEQQIVEYLKGNFKKGVAFRFMPNEVQRWCNKHREEKIFFMFTDEYGWGSKQIKINCSSSSVYALDYEYEQEFKPHWEEFEIDCDGYFTEKTSSDFKRVYYWWNWTEFLDHNSDKYNDFGGWVYEVPHSDGEKVEFLVTSPHILERGKDLCSFTVLDGKNELKPAYPSKILFWRHKE